MRGYEVGTSHAVLRTFLNYCQAMFLLPVFVIGIDCRFSFI